MNRTQRIAATVSVLAVAGLVAFAVTPILSAPAPTAPAAAETPAVADSPEAKPEARPAAKPAGATPELAPDGCRMGTMITFSKVSADAPMTGGLRGELTDRGPSEAASGTVTDDGAAVSYTVEPGDALLGIGSRFCVDYVTVAKYNHVSLFNDIHPGDVLVLKPDPSVEWVDPNAS